MVKKIVVLVLICVVVLGCLGCIDKEEVVVPSSDVTPEMLLPKDVKGITLVNKLPMYASIIGAYDGVKGNYVDDNNTKIIVTIYRYEDAADAKKNVASIRNDLLLKTKFRSLGEDEVIVFNKGYFLFAIRGNSSASVEKLAKATGYYP